MGIKAINNILNEFVEHLRTLNFFDQKSKKFNPGEIYFVVNFQGRAAWVACKSLDDKKTEKFTGKCATLYI